MPTPTTLQRQIAEGTTCRVHNLTLQQEVVPVTHGMPLADSEGFYEAEKQFFPLANKTSYHGCMSFPDEPTQEAVLFCSQCRNAQDQWLGQHPRRLQR